MRDGQGTADDRGPHENPWTTWKSTVVDILRDDYHDILPGIQEHDIDWNAWRHYYDDGSVPRTAVNRAFERY